MFRSGQEAGVELASTRFGRIDDRAAMLGEDLRKGEATLVIKN